MLDELQELADTFKSKIECYERQSDLHDARDECFACKVDVAKAHTWEDAYFRLMDFINAEREKSTHTEDAVSHGRWSGCGYCSICGYPMPIETLLSRISAKNNYYCYHCGARMDR